jgi:hypothetical protein
MSPQRIGANDQASSIAPAVAADACAGGEPVSAGAEHARALRLVISGELGRPHCRSVFSYHMQLQGGHLCQGTPPADPDILRLLDA